MRREETGEGAKADEGEGKDRGRAEEEGRRRGRGRSLARVRVPNRSQISGLSDSDRPENNFDLQKAVFSHA